MAQADPDAEGYDPQDRAEIFDETHNTDESPSPDETRSFEPDLFDDVYDATAAQGDGDDDDGALDAADYDPDAEDIVDEDDNAPGYLKDGLEDRDDDLVMDVFRTEADGARTLAGEAGLEFVGDVDDATRPRDRLARRYESNGELSALDLRGLGYGNNEKENAVSQDIKGRRGQKPEHAGSGAHADDIKDESIPRQEDLLDEGIEETFPASDPVSVKHIT